MLHVNKPDFFNFLILVSLFCRIRGEFFGEFDGVKEQKKIAFGPQPGNNFDGTSDEATITPNITVDEEKFDDNELKKLFIQNFERYYNLSRQNKDLIPVKASNFGQSEDVAQKRSTAVGGNRHRKVRRANDDIPNYNLTCYRCDGSNGSHEEQACYDGTVKNVKKCEEAAQCYIELHPQYIKRGCILPNKINRTFVCKCPLCNGNPSWDHMLYTYRSMRDWQFDNYRLQTALQDVTLICKSCSTKTDDPIGKRFVQKCKDGYKSGFMKCPRNSVCYTNIDDESGHVSRGCIGAPVYNPIYIFCKNSLCNDKKFLNPTTRNDLEHPILKRLFQNVKKPRNEYTFSESQTGPLKLTSYSDSLNINFWIVVGSIYVSNYDQLFIRSKVLL